MDRTIQLIEPNTKYYLQKTLQKCHEFKNNYYSILLNFAILFAFLLFTGCILYYRYKGQMTPYEKQQKLIKDQEYILSKIRYYHDEKKRASFSNFTDLPIGHPDYDIALRRPDDPNI